MKYNIAAFLPEFFLLLTVITAILAELFRSRATPKTFYTIAKTGMIAAFLASVVFYNQTPLPGYYENNAHITLFKGVVYVLSGSCMYLSLKWFLGLDRPSFAFYLLVLLSVLFLTAALSAVNLAVMFAFLTAAFALNIAQNVAIKAKTPVAIFSLEMSKEQLVQRMLCSEAEVDTQRLKTGHMQSKDWEKLADAMNSFAQAPIYIDDTSGCTLTDVRAKCRRLKMEEKNLGLVVIDYLQLMESSGREDRMQQISAISRGLKTLARELDVPVIALSQLSRAVESRTDKRPMLSDLRESGAIEQDADIVMFIYRDEYYRKADGEEDESIKAANKGESEIIIAKHRNGPVGTVKLLFQGNITKFKNPIKTDVF